MFAKSLLILGLAAIGSSFTLRDGLPNGAYRAYINEEGKEVHEPVPVGTTALDTRSLPATQYTRSKRQPIVERYSQTWCGCTDSLSASDTNAANQDLGDQVSTNPLIGTGMAFYSIRDSVVAFVCNKDVQTVNIPPVAVSEGSGEVTSACGLFIAGTSRLQGSVALDYGYMNYQSGLNFCEAAEGSQSSSCCLAGSQRWNSFQSCINGCKTPACTVFCWRDDESCPQEM
jgi:hypothetical protein